MPLQIPVWILYNNPIQSERLFLFNVFTPNWFALYNIHALVTSLEPMGCFLWQRDNMARLLQAMGSQLCSPGPSTPVSMQQQWELFQNCNNKKKKKHFYCRKTGSSCGLVKVFNDSLDIYSLIGYSRFKSITVPATAAFKSTWSMSKVSSAPTAAKGLWLQRNRHKDTQLSS